MEWRSAAVDRIMALQPRRVLEIGAGSGLVLSQIAPHCEHYVATDMSAVAIDNLARSLEQLQIPWRDRVQLLTQPAHVTGTLPQRLLRHHHSQLGRPVLPQRGDIWPMSSTTPWNCWHRAGHCSSATSVTTPCRARSKPQSRWPAPTPADAAEIRQRVQRAMVSEAELLLGARVFHHLGRRPPGSGRTRHPSQTRIGRQRTEPLPLRRHRPQNSRAGAVTGQRTHLAVGPLCRPSRTAEPTDIRATRRRPHRRDPPRRARHRRPCRRRAGCRATRSRRTRSSDRRNP